MNKRVLLLLGLLAGPARAETLAQAVDMAYASNPVLAAARARQESLAETPEQARAAGRLTAAADAAAGYDKFDYGKGGAATVSADLPIWTGGRVSSSVRAAERDVAAGAEGLRGVLDYRQAERVLTRTSQIAGFRLRRTGERQIMKLLASRQRADELAGPEPTK